MTPVRFFTASSLAMRLRKVREAGGLEPELAHIGKAELIIYELGYPPMRLRRGQTPVPSHRRQLRKEEHHHEKRSIINTHNL